MPDETSESDSGDTANTAQNSPQEPTDAPDSTDDPEPDVEPTPSVPATLTAGHAYEPADPNSLTNHPRNPRRGDVDAIRESIRTHGFHSPLVVQKSTRHVLVGNHRLEAARLENLTEVPVVWVDVNDDEAVRLLLADNRTADQGRYDEQLLADLLTEQAAASTAALAATGYDPTHLAALIERTEAEQARQRAADDPEPDVDDRYKIPDNPVTHAGDLWQLGPHRLLCGDARNADDVDRLLETDVELNLAITSPPYADRRGYDETSQFERVPPDKYVDWFAPVAANVERHLAHDGSWIVNIRAGADGLDRQTYVLDLVLAHVRQWGWHWGEEYCWQRPGIPMRPAHRLKNKFEPIYQFARNEWKFRPGAVQHRSNNAITADIYGHPEGWQGSRRRRKHGSTELAERGPTRSTYMGDGVQGTNAEPGDYLGDGWAYPGNMVPMFTGDHEATGHSAAFPVGLPEWFALLYTDSGDTIYDPFVGSGSTLLAAHRSERVGYGIEISPAYCDIALERIERRTGLRPIRTAADGTVEEHSFLGTEEREQIDAEIAARQIESDSEQIDA